MSGLAGEETVVSAAQETLGTSRAARLASVDVRTRLAVVRWLQRAHSRGTSHGELGRALGLVTLWYC